jgi:hypothetical protein
MGKGRPRGARESRAAVRGSLCHPTAEIAALLGEGKLRARALAEETITITSWN